jgi:hypothetical protein
LKKHGGKEESHNFALYTLPKFVALGRRRRKNFTTDLVSFAAARQAQSAAAKYWRGSEAYRKNIQPN